MISPISFSTYTYPVTGSNAIGYAVNPVSRVKSVSPIDQQSTNYIDKTNPAECETCKNRKYVDGSNDSNVSYKTPTYISPQDSFAAVASHEQEHVSKAISEGSKPGNQLVSSSVTLKMSVCPDCGTPYVAGGTTRTTLQYNESNPYEKYRKSLEGSIIKGLYVNYVA